MENEIKTIQEDSFKRKNTLLEQFADNGIEKAISESDFDARYGQGHQVFTMAGINKFVEDATKEGASDEVVKGIEDELKSLSKVVVNTGEGYESRFVRAEKEVEEDDSVSKGEEDDLDDESEEDDDLEDEGGQDSDDDSDDDDESEEEESDEDESEEEEEEA